MQLSLEPKAIEDVYRTPLVQQTAFWSRVKATLGMKSRAFEFSVRNSDIYTGVGGWSRTNADVVVFAQQVNDEDWIAYMPYGPEIEPSEENQGVFLEELSEELRRFLPKGCIALRYDLNWQSHWVTEQDFDADGEWRGGPRKVFQEMQLNFGTANGNLFKSLTNVLRRHHRRGFGQVRRRHAGGDEGEDPLQHRAVVATRDRGAGAGIFGSPRLVFALYGDVSPQRPSRE